MVEGAPRVDESIIAEGIIKDINSIPTNKDSEKVKPDQRTVWFIDTNPHGMQALSTVIAGLVKEKFSSNVEFKSYGTADTALRLLSQGQNSVSDEVVIPDLIVVGDLSNSSEGLRQQAELEQAINQLPIANKPKVAKMERGMLSMDFAKIVGDNLPAKAELTMIRKVEEPSEKVEAGQMDRAA